MGTVLFVQTGNVHAQIQVGTAEGNGDFRAFNRGVHSEIIRKS